MNKPGRKSSAALSVVANSPIEATERPLPPAELTLEQKREWVEVVNRLPADWFPRETWALLAQYCRHVVAARHVAQLLQRVESLDEVDVEQYDRLLKMQEREGRALSSLATRMRMSQQASYDAKRGKGKQSITKKPWE
jgi:hypothetical protein